MQVKKTLLRTTTIFVKNCVLYVYDRLFQQMHSFSLLLAGPAETKHWFGVLKVPNHSLKKEDCCGFLTGNFPT